MAYLTEYRKSVDSFEISHHSTSIRLKDSRVGSRLDRRKIIVSKMLLWGNTRDSTIWKRQNIKKNCFFCIITFRGEKDVSSEEKVKIMCACVKHLRPPLTKVHGYTNKKKKQMCCCKQERLLNV